MRRLPRGNDYLTGSAWREYQNGCRELCGVKLPEGMKENQKFPTPIITPTTKADAGHDENISKEEIIAQGLVSKEDYELMEKYTYALFARGTEMAAVKLIVPSDNCNGMAGIVMPNSFGLIIGKIV